MTQFSADSFEYLGLNKDGIDASCVCGLFDYISEMQKVLVGRFTSINIQSENQYMGLDLTARRNLELTGNIEG